MSLSNGPSRCRLSVPVGIAFVDRLKISVRFQTETRSSCEYSRRSRTCVLSWFAGNHPLGLSPVILQRICRRRNRLLRGSGVSPMALFLLHPNLSTLLVNLRVVSVCVWLSLGCPFHFSFAPRRRSRRQERRQKGTGPSHPVFP